MKYYVVQYHSDGTEMCVLQIDDGGIKNAYFAYRTPKTIMAKVSHDEAIKKLRFLPNAVIVGNDGDIKYTPIKEDRIISSNLYMIPVNEYDLFIAEQKLRRT
jgi:hypothetical protein